MDLAAFAADSESLALRLDAADLFGLLTRRVALPGEIAALVTTDDRRTRFEPAGATIDAAGVREVFLARTGPVQYPFEVAAAQSADGHECTASASLAVAVVPQQADFESFRRAILGASRRADAGRISTYLRDAVQRALYEFIRGRPAEALIESRADADFSAELVRALQPLLFAAGLSIGRHVALDVSSPAFESARRAQRDADLARQRMGVERELREAALAAQRLHVEELSHALERLDALARERPGVSVGDLVRTFDAQERGALYRRLLTRSVSAQRTAAVAVVAGSELILFNPNDGAVGLRRDFGATLGPLRSIRITDDGRTYLIGAATGVYLFRPDEGEPRAYSFTPRKKLRGGVNAAVRLGAALYATHSEVGLLRWRVDRPDGAEILLADQTAGAPSVRDVQADGQGALWFTAADRVIGWSPGEGGAVQSTVVPIEAAAGGPRGGSGSTGSGVSPAGGGVSPAGGSGTLVSIGSIAGSGVAPRVESLCVADGEIYAGASDGRLLTWPCGAPGRPEALISGEAGRIESVQWMSGAGVRRLLVACQRPSVWLLVLGDAHRIEYRADEPLRWAAAADDWILSVNDRRDRVFLWRPWQPESVERTIFVGRQIGRSIQDAAVVPQV